MLPAGLLFFAVAAAGPTVFPPETLYLAALEKMEALDDQALLVVAAYKEGTIDGRFKDATFVFHSQKLVENQSGFDSYQVVLRAGEVDQVTEVLFEPSGTQIPAYLPAKALATARGWWLNRWWAHNREASLDMVLYPRRESDDVWPSVHWIWEVTGRGKEEDCSVLLDGESLKRLRVKIEPAPDVTAPANTVDSPF